MDSESPLNWDKIANTGPTLKLSNEVIPIFEQINEDTFDLLILMIIICILLSVFFCLLVYNNNKFNINNSKIIYKNDEDSSISWD